MSEVSLQIQPGLTAVLGRNGAGKTTLLRILTTLLRPTEGSVHFDGVDTARHLGEARRSIGYLPQEFHPYPELTVREFLEHMQSLAAVSDRQQDKRQIDSLIDLLNLQNYQFVLTKSLSGGTRRRLGLAQAVLGAPTFVVLDEPTAGLDPEERVRVRQLLANLATRSTVLLSTHLIEDVESLANRVFVLERGRIVYDGSRQGIAEIARGRVFVTTRPEPCIPLTNCTVTSAVPMEGGFRLRVIAGPNFDGGFDGLGCEPTLEDGYLALLSSIQ